MGARGRGDRAAASRERRPRHDQRDSPAAARRRSTALGARGEDPRRARAWPPTRRRRCCAAWRRIRAPRVRARGPSRSSPTSAVRAPVGRRRCRIVLRVARAATLVVAAPGGRVDEAASLPGDLLVEVSRAEPSARGGGRAARAAGRAAARLPRRRGDARSATRSARASTSRSSTSAGSQCSDFLAFERETLERGVERGPGRARRRGR